jgi:hypothetical protein
MKLLKWPGMIGYSILGSGFGGEVGEALATGGGEVGEVLAAGIPA